MPICLNSFALKTASGRFECKTVKLCGVLAVLSATGLIELFKCYERTERVMIDCISGLSHGASPG